ncbi:methyl-accepting chemotaxis protein [Marinobacter nanhaiticus D15-8W]|nr:methyl-accepting chemotaxis protein [Marinobacter nanhaiticus D15-8W]
MKAKLLTLVAPALIVILIFAAGRISASYDNFHNTRVLQAMIEQVRLGAPVVENLQRERGRSAVYIASGGQSQEAESGLQTQRADTDAAIRDFRQQVQPLLAAGNLPESIVSGAEQFLGELQKLGGLRQAVDRLEKTGAESARFYTDLITDVIDLEGRILRRSSSATVTRLMAAYHGLSEGVEMAGRERAIGAGLVQSNQFSLETAARITELYGQQVALFRSAAEMLDEESRETVKAAVASANARAMGKLRNTLILSETGILQMTPGQWFDEATDRIEVLNGIRNDLLDEVAVVTQAEVSAARSALVTTSVMAAGAVVLVLVLVGLITAAITGQVRNLLEGVRYAMDNKDLSQPLTVTSRDEIGDIGRAVNDLFQRFGQALRQIDQASVQLATATEETSSTASQNAGQVRNQQQQIEQVAAATEEMSATSEEISRNTQQVAEAATSATDKSREGERVLRTSVERIHELVQSVQQVNQVIEELEGRSGTISEVINVIRQVADQTNLLALNAAIEAARAGEHGRGFAVVADEVRTLARQTHESTTEIEGIINGFRDITENAGRSVTASYQLATQTSDSAGELEKTLADILADVGRISDMATQIAAASEQQVSVTREVSGNMESVSEVAILTLTGSQEITQVTGEQARLARQLQDLANEFRLPATV